MAAHHGHKRAAQTMLCGAILGPFVLLGGLRLFAWALNGLGHLLHGGF